MSADRPAGQCTGFWQAKRDRGITAYLSASVCCARGAAPLKSSAHGVAHTNVSDTTREKRPKRAPESATFARPHADRRAADGAEEGPRCRELDAQGRHRCRGRLPLLLDDLASSTRSARCRMLRCWTSHAHWHGDERFFTPSSTLRAAFHLGVPACPHLPRLRTHSLTMVSLAPQIVKSVSCLGSFSDERDKQQG